MTLPDKALAELAAQAADCCRCPLYRNATRTVFGQGPAAAVVEPASRPCTLLHPAPARRGQSGARQGRFSLIIGYFVQLAVLN
jgi:hypothetical protein